MSPNSQAALSAVLTPAISFQDVSKTYTSAKGDVHALDHVGFDIAPGEFFGLLGPNGAGKTTLISILGGLARATGGRVLVHGNDVVADYAAARRSLGIVPQELVFDPFFTVREAFRRTGRTGLRLAQFGNAHVTEDQSLGVCHSKNLRQPGIQQRFHICAGGHNFTLLTLLDFLLRTRERAHC